MKEDQERGGTEARLRQTVERLLYRAGEDGAKVIALTREASLFASVSPVDVLSVSFQNRPNLALFLKHLGMDQADHPDKQRGDREVRIYADLLGDENLPVVKYYGSEWNGATGRHEVFLEYIGDWNLQYQSLEHWFTAARRLAHLHAYFAARPETLFAQGYLLRFDAPYLSAWTERALIAVTQGYPADLAQRLRYVVGNYGRVESVLGAQPPTLVHNDLAPKNVLADRSHDPARICFVDWEMAGIGCGLLDLVDLKYGLDAQSDQEMRNAYCAELVGTGLLPSDPQAVERLFAACELHKIVYRTAHSQAWCLPVERVAQWITDAERLLTDL